MIVLSLKLNNFCAFNNFHINMSYPKKIVDSTIPGEFLSQRPNFRYKKLNVIMGANASGKTSLGRMLIAIFSFIGRGSEKILEQICDTSKEASFEIDFVPDGTTTLCRVRCHIDPETDDEQQDRFHTVLFKEEINIRDSYESCLKRMELNDRFQIIESDKDFRAIPPFGWYFTDPESRPILKTKRINTNDYVKILDTVLKSIDPSIKGVESIDNAKNSCVIHMKHRDVLLQEGEIVHSSILSSGTISGIDIAEMITWIMGGGSKFYYCDEKFTFLHSDVEKAFLSVVLALLKPDSQLFFTSHNLEILDMPFPKHSFVFLKKESGGEDRIEAIYASDFLKRNTDSVKNAAQNDLFLAAPELEQIYQLAEMEIE